MSIFGIFIFLSNETLDSVADHSLNIHSVYKNLVHLTPAAWKKVDCNCDYLNS